MTEAADHDTESMLDRTASIVSAYVAHNPISGESLPAFISSVHSALNAAAGSTTSAPKVELVPAVSIKRSITPDYLICLEDGKKFKSLKRHLRTHYDMSPEQYRTKWDLPYDYPMVAPAYASARSALAISMGLGKAGHAAKAKIKGKAKR
jgi:predicted transcriptional regulator